MIELSPGSGIYVYDKHIDQAIARKSCISGHLFLYKYQNGWHESDWGQWQTLSWQEQHWQHTRWVLYNPDNANLLFSIINVLLALIDIERWQQSYFLKWCGAFHRTGV